MIEEVLSNLYKIELPLPQNPLGGVNCYLLKGEGQFLLIDTGMNRQECRQEIYSDLRSLDVDLKKTDIFITHFHADHLGLATSLATETSTIYLNSVEVPVVGNLEKHWRETSGFARLHGFPENELDKALRAHPGYRYGLRDCADFSILEEGDRIRIGDYSFVCIETPGHSPGHMCLYEPNKKILVSGDHILIDITPNIQLWSDKGDPLNEYLKSLDRIYDLGVDLVLPGHRDIFTNHKKRIQEIKLHHEVRANEILSILEKGGQTAYEVASQMRWDVSYGFWKLFPISQKWFAVGEALSHLKYLKERKMIRQDMQRQKVVSLTLT